MVLGTGKRLFADSVPVALQLTSSTATRSGVVANVYRRSGAVEVGTIDVDSAGAIVDDRGNR